MLQTNLGRAEQPQGSEVRILAITLCTYAIISTRLLWSLLFDGLDVALRYLGFPPFKFERIRPVFHRCLIEDDVLSTVALAIFGDNICYASAFSMLVSIVVKTATSISQTVF
jgi:hypothetical protein